MKFEWDPAKAEINLVKHGIDFEDAQTIFEGTIIRKTDLRRDYGERRWRIIGQI